MAKQIAEEMRHSVGTIFPVKPEKAFETIWWITPVSQSMVHVTIFSIFELVLQVGANHQGANRTDYGWLSYYMTRV